MVANLLSIEEQPGGVVDAAELEHEPPALPVLGQLEQPLVPGPPK